jgi:hypothetical protein
MLKVHIPSTKLLGLIRKAVQQPKLRIVETGRKRRLKEVSEDPPEPPKKDEKPFGGILTKEDADTSKTIPVEIDRARFERARENAVYPPVEYTDIDSCPVEYYSRTISE